LLPDAWLHKLRLYPHQDLVQYFIHNVTMGFRLEVCYSQQKSSTDHPNVVDDYLKKSYHLAGYLAHIYYLHVPGFTSIDLVLHQKNHQQDKWRLITDLSHTSGSSVNDGIPFQL